MSPAGAAVLRDVLVTGRTDVVDAIYVPPVPGLWQLNQVQEFMRTGCGSEAEEKKKKSLQHRAALRGLVTEQAAAEVFGQVCTFQPSPELIPANYCMKGIRASWT